MGSIARILRSTEEIVIGDLYRQGDNKCQRLTASSLSAAPKGEDDWGDA